MFLRLMLLFAVLMLPEFSFAQESMFQLAPQDKSLLVLSSIFGGLGTFGPGTDAFAAGIEVFNGGVLMICGILVAYTIITGTLGTAHDGEMLGKKFSSVWVPIRTALGTALVMPVINGTYCVMQAIVGWLIVQGIGLADTVWTSYTSDSSLQLLSSAGLKSVKAKDFGYKVFQSQVCMKAIQAVIDTMKNGAPGVQATPELLPSGLETKITTVTGPGTLTYKFGANMETFGLSANTCGEATIPTVITNTVTESSSLLTSLFNKNETIQGIARANAITTAQVDGATTLISTMGTLANNLISSMAPIQSTSIDDAIQAYEGGVLATSASQIANLNEFKTLSANASQDGWLLAGAFYTKISYMADLVQRSATNLATATGPMGVPNSTLNDQLTKYEKLISATLTSNQSNPSPMGWGINAESGQESSIFSNFSFDKVMKKVFQFEAYVIDDNENPLMAMKRMGSWMLGGASSIIASYVYISLAALTAKASALGVVTKLALPVAPAIAELITGPFVSTLITISVIPILVTGITLSYILPMMPFFLWFGAALGWVVLCVEAIIAAPIWAIMHLSPHGDDMVGTGGQGYKLVLSLMLRPVLMIFGLIASFILMSVMGKLLTQVFFGVFSSAQQDSSFLIIIVGYLIAPILYSVSMYVLIKKLFSMIHVIPDELLKWFGGGGANLGDYANTVGGENSASHRAIGTIIQTSSTGLRDAGVSSKTAADKKLLDTKMEKQDEIKENGKLSLEKVEQDKNYGAGASDIISAASGGNQLKAAETMQTLGNIQTSLGGKSSPESTQFMAKLGELSSTNSKLPPGDQKSFADLAQTAANHVVDSNHGAGAGKLATSIGGYAGSSEYKRAIDSFAGKESNLVRSGVDPEDAKSMVSDMVSNTLSRHGNEGGSLKQILSEESNKINADVGIVRPEPNTAVKDPVDPLFKKS